MKFKIIGALVLGLIVYAIGSRYNLLPSAITIKSAVPEKFDLPSASSEPSAPVADKAALPTTTALAPKGSSIRFSIWAWNAQMGLIFANGGPVTTKGSLMEKHNLRVEITRRDDTEISKKGQVELAEAIAGGNGEPTNGVHFVNIMGDGSAQYLASINKTLERLGPDYRAEIVGAVGYSRGEDAFMGPEAWKANPEAMKGGLVSGVLRDGDWNLAVYYAAQNNIRNNPDEKTWDPEALNWAATDDYVKAAEMYVTGYCEDRETVKDGRKTGEKLNHCVDGTVTWTPGDVTVAKKKGGLVKILSTKENAYQMPSVVIGIHKWNVTHQKQIEELLLAAFEGADQVRSFPDALKRAAVASYAVYKEENPSYWEKYYKGVIESDKQQQPIALGGSAVANLNDNLLLFGMSEGSGGVKSSLFRASYEGFGKIAQQQYPRLVPSFQPVEQAFNPVFLQALVGRSAASAPAEVATYDAPTPMEKENVVAKRNWNIQFATGSAAFTPEAESTLNELYTALVAGSLSVEIQGHTDNVGNPISNKGLSEQRAFAVKQWLEQKAPTLFPENRTNVRAFGDAQPIAPNSTPEGRARNRRVTILLGTR